MKILLALVATVIVAAKAQEEETFGDATEVQRTFNINWDKISKKFKCPAIYGRYPHPESCEYFFECRFGLPVVMHCNKGYLYDENREQCRENRRVHCRITGTGGEDEDSGEVEEEVFQCPYIWGTFAHPRDCSMYYVCVYKLPTLHQCHSAELYDSRARKCIPRNRVDCGKRVDKKKPKEKDVLFKCPRSCGIYDHPKDCSTFIVCVDNVPSAFVCPQNQFFDVSSKKCLPKHMVTCNKGINPDGSKRTTVTPRDKVTHRTTSSPRFTQGPKVFFCPFPEGRFADPSDCARYYECRSGVSSLKQCPLNQLYDERQETCRNRNEVHCGNRPGGGGVDDGRNRDNIWCPYSWGSFVHPRDCSKFIICVYNVPTLYSCRKNELFDEVSRRCLPANQVDCGNRINPDDLFRPGGKTTQVFTRQTVFPERTTGNTAGWSWRPVTTPRTTQRPIVTTQLPRTTQRPIVTTLSPRTTQRPRTTFNPPYTTERPSKRPNTPPPTDCKEDDIDCIIDGTGDPKGWFDCPGMFGHYPHAASKQLFIHCDRWRPFVKSCADGTEFSPQFLVCVWKSRS